MSVCTLPEMLNKNGTQIVVNVVPSASAKSFRDTQRSCPVLLGRRCIAQTN